MARGAAKEKAETAAAAAPAGGASDNSRALPLAKRSVDALLSFWFLMFAFSTTFTDIHNFTASWLGVEVVALEHMKLLWPPPVLTQVYFRWARTVDPLLYQNPVFWQCIEWVNLLCLTPFAFVAVVAFLRGWSWVRIPAIVVSSFTAYSLVICIGTTLYGPERSADPSTFTGIYLIYLLQPLVVIARLWHDRPFSRLHGGWNAVLCTATLVNMAVFFSYVAKWMVLYEPGVLGPLLPHLLPAAQLP